VAASPYWGVEGVYASNIDPWQNWDNRQFMQSYYQLTTEYAKRGGISYPVRAATCTACCYAQQFATNACNVLHTSHFIMCTVTTSAADKRKQREVQSTR
jgi:hypothetical protein